MTTPAPPMGQIVGPSFANGYQQGRGMESPGLEAQSARWNNMAQSSLGRPTSVLSQIGLSAVSQNASAPSMADRFNEFTGTVMPNTNTGSSEESAPTALKLRFLGNEGEV